MRELAALIVTLFLGFAAGFVTKSLQFDRSPMVVTQVDTLTVRDTVCVSEVITETVTRWRTDTVVLRSVDSVEVAVEIPVEYKETVFEDAVVSHHGYRSEIDSVLVFPKTEIITRVERVTALQAPKRWSFGVTAGPSALVTPSGGVKAGVGVTAGISCRF